MRAANEAAITNTPPGALIAKPFGRGNSDFNASPNNLVIMAPEALAPAGGDQPHNNLQPFLTFYFCIALQGVFPPRG
jgi:microcystin-dependent protein